MPLPEALYEAVTAAARPIAGLAAPLHPKLSRAVAGRRASAPLLEAWAAAERDPSRPLVWFHAPSVGEGLMAQAVMGALRELRPDVQLAFTHFSPSAERLATRVGADVHAYLPWDTRASMRRVLDALRPALIAFVRTEIWPVLTREAGRRGVRLALVNAILPESSSRLRPVSRWLLRPAYARLDAVGAVAAEDAGRFTRLGVSQDRVHVTGDARFDQVWARVQRGAGRGGGGHEATGTAAILDRLRDVDAFTLLAGSTWPADEAHLVPAFAELRASLPRARLIIAPHEPDQAHLEGLERTLDRAGLPHARLAEVERTADPLPPVVLIDRVGILADLYAIAELTYVGGGFHAAGLHSVVEPAALERPVLFGPRNSNAREVAELEAAGGGFTVRNAEDITRRLTEFARDADRRHAAGQAAVAYVRSRLGGASANARLLAPLIDPVPAGPPPAVDLPGPGSPGPPAPRA